MRRLLPILTLVAAMGLSGLVEAEEITFEFGLFGANQAAVDLNGEQSASTTAGSTVTVTLTATAGTVGVDGGFDDGDADVFRHNGTHIFGINAAGDNDQTRALDGGSGKAEAMQLVFTTDLPATFTLVSAEFLNFSHSEEGALAFEGGTTLSFDVEDTHVVFGNRLVVNQPFTPGDPIVLSYVAGDGFSLLALTLEVCPLPEEVDGGSGPAGSIKYHEDFQTFIGTGFVPVPIGGSELDSDEWAVIGLSDGEGLFGGEHVSGDFARGPEVGGSESVGGIYSFSDGGNYFLAVQPTDNDFTPGAFTLRLANDIGIPVARVDLQYDIFFLNDNDRANSLNFRYITGDGHCVEVPELDFTTPEAAAAQPVFEGVARQTTIRFNPPLAPGAELYLQWYGDDVSGSGSRDEYGLDNIQVEAIFFPLVVGQAFFGEEVRVYDLNAPSTPILSTVPFPTSSPGFNVAAADLNGDGIGDIVAGTAITTAIVAVLDGTDGTTILPPLILGSNSAQVATGDLIGDTTPDIVVAVEGADGQVYIFDGATGGPGGSFLAYPGEPVGARVACGDVTGDGCPDIITGPGGTFNGSGSIRVFNAAGLELHRFDVLPGAEGGLHVAADDLDGDGLAEILVGTATGPPTVHVFNARDLMNGRTDPALTFTAYDLAEEDNASSGAPVGTVDADGDGVAEIVTGHTVLNRVKVLDGVDPMLVGGVALGDFADFVAFESGSGVNVGSRAALKGDPVEPPPLAGVFTKQQITSGDAPLPDPSDQPSRPSIAMNASGYQVVAWNPDSVPGENEGGMALYRIIDPDGTPLNGGPQSASPTTGVHQVAFGPTVAMRPGDEGLPDFVMAWSRDDVESDAFNGIYYQIFRDGVPDANGPFHESLGTGFTHAPPGLAVAPDGSFAFVIALIEVPFAVGATIRSDGQIVAQFAGPELSGLTFDSPPMSFCSFADDSFLLATASAETDGKAMRLALTDFGFPFTLFSAPEDPDAIQTQPSVACLADGGFVVVWTNFEAGLPQPGVKLRRYNALDEAVGLPRIIADAGVHTLSESLVAVDGQENLVLAYTDTHPDPAEGGQQVKLVRLDTAGNILEELSVTDPGTTDLAPAVAASPTSSRHAVAWVEHFDSDSQPRYAVRHCLFTPGLIIPQLTDIAPDSGGQGETLTVKLSGSGLRVVTAVEVEAFEEDIVVNGFTVTNNTCIELELEIGEDAAPGLRDITVTAPTGSDTLADAFEVIPVPRIDGIAPAEARQGTTFVLEIAGIGFDRVDGVAIEALAGEGAGLSGVEVLGLDSVSPTRVAASVLVHADSVALTPRDVTVMSTDGLPDTLADGFTVLPVPVLEQVSPAELFQGETAVLTFTGTGFDEVTEAAFEESGAEVLLITVDTPTSIEVSVRVLRDAAIGFHDASVTSPTDTSLLADAVEVIPVPIIDSITPTEVRQGTTFTLEIAGTGFDRVDGVAIEALAGEGAGLSRVEVESFNVLGPTLIEAEATVYPDSVALVARDVTVASAGGVQDTLAGAFTVLPVPVIQQLSPADVFQGETLTLTLIGTGFDRVDQVHVEGSGVTVDQIVQVAPNTVEVQLTVAVDAPATTRDIMVMTSDGLAHTLADALTVLFFPRLAGVAPGAGFQGSTIQLDLTGSSLDTVNLLQLGPGIAVSNQQVGSNAIEATLEIADDAAIGLRDVKVTTTDGAENRLVGAFEVLPFPDLDQVDPAAGLQGTIFDIEVTGQGLDHVTRLELGAGVSVTRLNVLSGNRLTARLRIASNALVGVRDLTVFTSDGVQDTLRRAFTIRTPPEITSLSPDTGRQGRTLEVTVRGRSLSQVQGIDLGPGITITNLVVQDTFIRATVTIGEDASTGLRDLILALVTGDTVRLGDSFTVTAAGDSDGDGDGSPCTLAGRTPGRPSVPFLLLVVWFVGVGVRRRR